MAITMSSFLINLFQKGIKYKHFGGRAFPSLSRVYSLHLERVEDRIQICAQALYTLSADGGMRFSITRELLLVFFSNADVSGSTEKGMFESNLRLGALFFVGTIVDFRAFALQK